jgi:hypothetical protein
MAKRYDVVLTRTTVETFKATVEASSEQKACVKAAVLAGAAAEWAPKSTSIDLATVQYCETIGSDE